MEEKNWQTDGSYQELTVAEVRAEVADVKVIVFTEASSRQLRYVPGQYLTLVDQDGGEEMRRSYSIISIPHHEPCIAIAVKRIGNGYFSRKLFDRVRPGDVLLSSGTGGLFTLPEAVSAPTTFFFLAAGSGITPIYALLKTLLLTHSHKAVLVYSNHDQGSTLFLQPLQQLEASYKGRLHVEWIFSNNPNLLKAHLHRDYLLQLVKERVGNSFDKAYFYTCGPLNYMRLCLFTLQEAGVPRDRIRKEDFALQRAKPNEAAVPDQAERMVQLRYMGAEYTFLSRYPDTLLKAARKAGISLPYSCESGICGNCLARCVGGEVWHAANEVLTPHDLKAGFVLTCTGYPVHGDVALTIP